MNAARLPLMANTALAATALLAAACNEATMIESQPVPIVGSVTITHERTEAIRTLMQALPAGARLREVDTLRVSADLGDNVAATAFLREDGETRVFALDAPREAEIALAYLVELKLAEGQQSGRVDLMREDVARYGAFAWSSPAGQERWTATLARVRGTGRREAIDGVDVFVSREPRGLRMRPPVRR